MVRGAVNFILGFGLRESINYQLEIAGGGGNWWLAGNNLIYFCSSWSLTLWKHW
jgi:hypothetical protein